MLEDVSDLEEEPKPPEPKPDDGRRTDAIPEDDLEDEPKNEEPAP